MNLPNYRGLDPKHEVYFMVSGGRDSTAMVLEARAIGIRGKMVFGDTRFNLREARETIKKLQEFTKYPLIQVRYEGAKKPIQILEQSFFGIPEAIRRHRLKKSYKHKFACCHILKKVPMTQFIKSIDHQNAVIILGIKGRDKALHRVFRMSELREWDTFFRRIKKTGLLHYYPLRDCDEHDIDTVLGEHGFESTIASGCSMCPFFCVGEQSFWKRRDPETWRRSTTYAKRLGIKFPGSANLRKICEE